MLPLFAAITGYVEGMTTPETAYALGETASNVRAMSIIARDTLFERAGITDPFTKQTLHSIHGFRSMLDVFYVVTGKTWQEFLTEEESVEQIELIAYFRAMRNYVNFSRHSKEQQNAIQTDHHAGRRHVA